MARKLYLIYLNFSDQMKKKNISAYAASTAFFLFLSIVPMLMLICTILPYTPLTEENLLEAVQDVVPGTVSALAVSLISEVYEKSAGIMSIAIIATAWSAAKGVLALMRGLNAVNDVEEQRNYFVVRGVASLYTIAMLIVVILGLFINVFGNQVMSLLLYRVPKLAEIVAFFMNFRFLVIWVVLTFLIAAIYAYVPDRKLRYREQIPGAAFSAVVWSVFSWGFSLYVSYTDSYGIYGSLSMIIIALLWLYFGMYIVLIGAYLNNYFRPVNQVLVGSRNSQKSST